MRSRQSAMMAAAGEQQGKSAGNRFGQQVDVTAQPAVGTIEPRPVLGHALEVVEAVTEARSAFGERDVEGRVLVWPIAGGHAEQQPTARQCVGAGGRLGHMGRVAKGEHDAGHRQGDALGDPGQQAEVHEGVEDLASVAEGGHVERDVTQPDGGEPELVGQPDLFQVAVHRRHGR